MLGCRRLAVAVVAGVLLTLGGQASASRVQIDQVTGARTILDVQPDRMFLIDRAGFLTIQDRQTGALTRISASPGFNRYGWLTPHGAIFADIDASSNQRKLYEWRDGSLIKLADNGLLAVSGKYAAFQDATQLLLRDLDLGSNLAVGPLSGDFDLAANGDVVYSAGSNSYQVYRYRNGATAQLTNDPTTWNNLPLTDGTLVVYRKISPCCFNENGSVAVYTPSGEVVLDSFRNAWPEAYFDYQLAGGWVAYTHFGSSGERQIWERSPAGTVSQVSPSGTNALLVAMDGNGGVMFEVVGTSQVAPLILYLGRAGQQPINLGTSWSSGRRGHGDFIVWQDGSWYETARGTLFRFDPDPGYPRPRGATPMRASLVPADKGCTAPTTAHGQPLAYPSCRGPQLVSAFLTTGTPDSNGRLVRMQADLQMNARAGTIDRPADVDLSLQLNDLFTKALDDYTGQVRASVAVQGVDRENGKQSRSGTIDHVDLSGTRPEAFTAADHGLQDGEDVITSPKACGPDSTQITVTGPRSFTLDGWGVSCAGGIHPGDTWVEQGFRDPAPGTFDFTLSFPASCASTTDPAIGSDCSANTTANALVPGMVRAGDRTIWQLGQVKVFDGGASGVAGAPDETLFAVQGVFVP